MTWNSWKHKDTDFTHPLTFNEKVDLFYEGTLGWQLHIADLIANGGTTFGREGKPGYHVDAIDHSGFAVLHICFSYFELVGSMVMVKPDDTNPFMAGVKHVFPGLPVGSPDVERLLTLLFDGARNGLYHQGRTRHGVGLGAPPHGAAIGYSSQNDSVVISPSLLPKALKAHLEKFRLELLDTANTKLRERFQRRFDKGFN